MKWTKTNSFSSKSVFMHTFLINQERNLRTKIKRYIFIGYEERTKGYKLIDSTIKKVIVSRDVRINEASKWD